MSRVLSKFKNFINQNFIFIIMKNRFCRFVLLIFVMPYFQSEPLSEILNVPNIRHATSRTLYFVDFNRENFYISHENGQWMIFPLQCFKWGIIISRNDFQGLFMYFLNFVICYLSTVLHPNQRTVVELQWYVWILM